MLLDHCSSWSCSGVFIATHLSIFCALFITTAQAVDVAACTPAPTVTPCPTALQAATLLTGGSDLLPISNTAWTGPTTCSAAAPAYSLVTNFGCHYLSTNMPSGESCISKSDVVLSTAILLSEFSNSYQVEHVAATHLQGHADILSAAPTECIYLQSLRYRPLLSCGLLLLLISVLFNHHVRGCSLLPSITVLH